MSGGFSEKLVLVRVSEKFELASVELLEVNFIDQLFFIIMFLYLLAASFSLAGKMECPMIPSQTRLCQVFTFVCTI